jgi:phenylalanyl-tRNA synthetase alpha chain
MQSRLESLYESCLAEVGAAGSAAALQEVNQRYLGKKGALTAVLKALGSLSPEERKSVGKRANESKEAITGAIAARREAILEQASVVEGEVDLTLPGTPPVSGALHPVTQMCHDLNDAFRSLGFEIYAEDEITSEKYAFDNLNFPPDHPARESMDTYWIRGTEDASGARGCASVRTSPGGASVTCSGTAHPRGLCIPGTSTGTRPQTPATSARFTSTKR